MSRPEVRPSRLFVLIVSVSVGALLFEREVVCQCFLLAPCFLTARLFAVSSGLHTKEAGLIGFLNS